MWKMSFQNLIMLIKSIPDYETVKAEKEQDKESKVSLLEFAKMNNLKK